MTDVEDLPDWSPRDGLNARDLANALEHIRRSAWMHYIGGAFEPDHMGAIASAAAQALCGQPIDPPVDMGSPQFRAQVAAGHERLMSYCDDAIDAVAGPIESEGDDEGAAATPATRLRNRLAASPHPLLTDGDFDDLRAVLDELEQADADLREVSEENEQLRGCMRPDAAADGTVFPPSPRTVKRICADIRAKIGSYGVSEWGVGADEVWDAWEPFHLLPKEQQDVVVGLVYAEMYGA